MIGVILWSDPTEQKAVIWCEDHGDLAYLSRPDAVYLPDTFFDVGDVVEFDVETKRNLRLVTHASRVQQSWGTGLSDTLREVSDGRRANVDVRDSAEIIPFRVAPATCPLPAAPPRHQRRG